MSAEENKQRIRDLVEIFNAGDGERYLARYAEDAAIHGLPDELEPNKTGLGQFVGAVAAAFPDIQFTVEELVAEGDRVAFTGSYRATHQGEFMGVPPSGRAVDFQGMSIFRFGADGQIQERRILLDNATLMGQLGLTPQPEAAEARG